MKTLTPKQRRRLEAQGFGGIADDVLVEIEPWLRLVPAVSAVWATAGASLGSPAILLALCPLLAAGAVFDRHPFEVLYAGVFRRFWGGSELPPSPAPRRFGSALATLWIAIGAGFLVVGAGLAGTVWCGLYVAAALYNVTTGACPFAPVYRLVFGPARAYRLD